MRSNDYPQWSNFINTPHWCSLFDTIWRIREMPFCHQDSHKRNCVMNFGDTIWLRRNKLLNLWKTSKKHFIVARQEFKINLWWIMGLIWQLLGKNLEKYELDYSMVNFNHMVLLLRLHVVDLAIRLIDYIVNLINHLVNYTTLINL